MDFGRLAALAGLAFAAGVGVSVALMRVDLAETGGGERRARGEAEARLYRYERIVTMAPSIAEIVFELRQGERVAGVSRWTEYPLEARAKPEVGGWSDVNFEVLSELAPDLIIIQGEHLTMRGYARRRGIDVLAVDMRDLATIYEGITTIARALECAEEGEVLAARIRLELAETKAIAAGKPRPRVLVTLSRRTGTLEMLATAGGKDFLSEVIEAAGGRNIFDDVGRHWPIVNQESVVERQPEVILEASPGEEFTEEELAQRRRDWEGLSALPAVRDGRIYTITESYALIPGPRVGKLALRIARILHGAGGE